ncbi:hypothetical protein BJX64DRAFT_17753 [Aspergillus heterothallicus]
MAQLSQSGRVPGWQDVMVVGTLCSATLSYRTGLLALCGYARAVFAAQPARLFVLGFYTRGTEMQAWVFDLSGLYSGETIDIARSAERCSTILASYMLMNNAQLGVSDLIKEDSRGVYINRGDNTNTNARRLYLDTPATFARVNKNLISDGMTCYRARLANSERCEYAVKIKWSPDSDKSEVKMLQLANERKPWGVLQLFDHQAICSTDSLHNGLAFGAPQSFGSGHGDDTLGPSDTNAKGSGNRILNCITVHPLGESLHRFETVSEVLHALSHAVKAHRSLYQETEILHQDICPGNIIIPSRKVQWAPTDPKGVLIDLDMAKQRSEPWKQFEGIGTPPFQAIGVLQAYLPNNPHTFRHDLELFLYTFLFLAICQRPVAPGLNQLQLPTASVLNQWTQGRPVDQAKSKTNDMSATNFGRITDEFTTEFKPFKGLAVSLRDRLFPERDRKPWTGTDMTEEGTNALYDAVIDCFEQGIADLARL